MKKVLVLVVGLLSCGSVYAGEVPNYLTPPKQNEHTISKVAFVGFGVSAAVAVVLGLVAVSKLGPTASKSQLTAANNMLTASMVCDGMAVLMLTTMVVYW